MLRGTLHTDKQNGGVSRTSKGAVHSTLTAEKHPDAYPPEVEVNTTLGESGGVSVRIELGGKVVLNEHWPIEELTAILQKRGA